MTTTPAPASRPLPRIRGPLSIAEWISRGCAESDAPAFPLSLYLIDCECTDGLDRLTLIAARLRLLIYALAYEIGTAERDENGSVTGRVCVSIPVACLTSFTGLKRGRVIEAMERLQATVWRFGGYGMTKIRSTHTGPFAAALETTGSVIEVTFDAVVSRHLMRPHGWAHMCLGRVREAASIHAVGLLPAASYWISLASRWQPRKETPRGDGANLGMRYSEFRQYHVTHAQLLGLALARHDMHQRDVNRYVIGAGMAAWGNVVDVTKHPILKNAGYDVIVSAPRKPDAIRQNPAVTGNIARYTINDIPALKLRPHDVIAALQRLGWMTYEDRARALLRTWTVYVHRLGDRATAADFAEMIELIAGGAEIEITRDDIIAADAARRARIRNLPETASVAAASGAQAWPVADIAALHRTAAQELEIDDADDCEPVDFVPSHIIDDGIPF